jgi:hypothetical protein
MSIKVYPFTNNFIFPDYKNVIRFKEESHRVAFFSNAQLGGTNFSATGTTTAYQSINFNWNDGYETTIRINNTDDSATTSPNNFLSYNYLHLVEQKGLETLQYFFFIKNAKFINADVIEYRIVLDVFTTHIQDIASDQPIMTERRHCQRFARFGTTPNFSWRFRSEDAILGDELDERFKAMIPETLNPQKQYIEYFTSTSSVPTEIEGYDDNFRAFVNEQLNETMWMYAFVLIDEDDSNQTGTRLLNNQPWIDSFDVGYRVLVAPVKTMGIIRTQNVGETTYIWNAKKLYESLMSDKLNPLAISIRLSPIAPFNNRMRFNDGGTTPQFVPAGSTIAIKVFTTQGNTHADLPFLKVDGSTTTGHDWFMLSGTGSSSSYWGDDTNALLGLITYSNISDVNANLLNQTEEALLNLPVYNAFNTLPTNTTTKSHNNEPKLKTAPYYRLELMTGYSPIKELNPIHFVAPTPIGYQLKFEVNDIPTIADQKYTYAISKSLANTYYANNLEYNKALVGNNLYEFVVRRDKFADYVANHSNYLLTGLAIPSISGLVNTSLQAVSGNYGRSITSGIDTVANAVNFFATMNDMERAPDTIKATGNNILHDFSLGINLGLKLAPFRLTAEQREMAFDYFYERGYRIMRESIWKASNDSIPSNLTGFTPYDAIFNRSRFNYIKLNDDELMRKFYTLNLPITQKAKTTFVDVLLRGVRMIESSATATTTIANFNTTTENMEYNTTLI